MIHARMIAWVINGVLGGIALVLAAAVQGGPEWIRSVLLVTGISLATAAVFGLVDWAAMRVVARMKELRQAEAFSERVALLERISRMDAQQLEFARQFVPVIELAAGDVGPVAWLRVAGGTIPMKFVAEFIDHGDEETLCPIRRYSDGSLERKWAEDFTRWCIWMGWAVEAAGNRSARWVNRERALRALGLETE